MPTIRTELQKRAQSAIIQYAFFRWESAVVIAMTIVLTALFPRPFAWWPLWGWPLLGVTGLAGIVATSLTDAETNAKVLLELFQEQFNPRVIQDQALREKVETALEYQQRIEALVRRQRRGVLRDHLENSANQLSDWMRNIYRLAQRLDAYRQDGLIAKERETVPGEIDELADRRQRQHNPQVREQLDEVLESKKKQWAALQALHTRMKQAELQLEQSVTALATIYSQVQLVDAQDVDSGRSERLQTDIKEQVDQLNDLIGAINEVYDYHTEGLG
ncbi:MAG: hypothetical protein MAG451_01911 [Anaerolineales bacterium]|nr:hypothetical protein [Anaerolineales bacterium]